MGLYWKRASQSSNHTDLMIQIPQEALSTPNAFGRGLKRNYYHYWANTKTLHYDLSYSWTTPASIVISRILSRVLERNYIYIYTAPYSPDLIPIELTFGSYKAALRRHRKEPCDPCDRAHNYGLTSVTPDIARAHFRHCKVPQCGNFPSQKELVEEKKNYDLLGETLITGSAALMSTLLLNKRH